VKHTCHQPGCSNACPPAHLMCRGCWSLVPPDVQLGVYRTVKIREDCVNATWAPWTRAVSRAVAAVMVSKGEDPTDYVAYKTAVAERMEKRP